MRSGVLTADARNGLLLAACTSSFLSQIAVIRVACCPNPNDRCQDACRVHTVGQKQSAINRVLASASKSTAALHLYCIRNQIDA